MELGEIRVFHSSKTFRSKTYDIGTAATLVQYPMGRNVDKVIMRFDDGEQYEMPRTDVEKDSSLLVFILETPVKLITFSLLDNFYDTLVYTLQGQFEEEILKHVTIPSTDWIRQQLKKEGYYLNRVSVARLTTKKEHLGQGYQPYDLGLYLHAQPIIPVITARLRPTMVHQHQVWHHGHFQE